MAKIKSILGSEILNAKGIPTVEVRVTLNDGRIGVASCPSGEVVGTYEAVDLKDNDSNRFEGQGVLKAVNNINTIIAPSLVGKEVEHQQDIDRTMIELDGTQNKSRLGANAMLATSMAVAKAGAESSVLPLFLYLRQFVKSEHSFLKIPTPIFNLLSGENPPKTLDFDEFLVLPASSKPYEESMRIGNILIKAFKKFLESKTLQTFNEYEEGFSANLSSNKEGFMAMKQAIEETQIKLGFDVFFGVNPKASKFFKDGKYRIKDLPNPLSSKELVNYYKELNDSVHILYFEDALHQDDWDGWSLLSQTLSSSSIIAGGELIATNPYRLQIALNKKAINAIVIKPNQIGTVIEALAIAQAAKETGLKIVVAHRSIETNDDFLADFAVAVAADYIKIGVLTRGENIAKYNRLLQIENQLKIL